MTALLEYLDLTALLEYINLLTGIQGALHEAPLSGWGPGKMPQLPPPPPLWAALVLCESICGVSSISL